MDDHGERTDSGNLCGGSSELVRGRHDLWVGWQVWAGFGAGLVISVLTTPVGVSGAVFLLPVQLDVLAVPSPRVTPTNLLFNVVAVPGALLRYRRQHQLGG